MFILFSALETEGVFRRSASPSLMKEIQEKLNRGEDFEFTDVHVAAVTLKKFLRELKEPIMTFELFPDIVSFHCECELIKNIEGCIDRFCSNPRVSSFFFFSFSSRASRREVGDGEGSHTEQTP